MIRRVSLCWAVVLALAACQSSPTVQPESNEGLNPFAALVRFYQGPMNHLSAVRTGQCPMYPSDSEYSLQALEKHGMVMGWIMSVDRLMRCGRDETSIAPKIRANGKIKTYDPVKDNDFWWHGRVKKTDTAPRAGDRESE